MDAVSRFIDINKWIIDINNSFFYINKSGLNVKTAAHTMGLYGTSQVLFCQTFNCLYN